jgi:fermentation-respiration switch protein FrsA (DUF1100 family)
VLTLAALLIALYLGMLAYVYVTQRSFIYLPDARRPDLVASGAAETFSAVALTAADGIATVSWYHAADAGRPTLVLFQGNAGNIADRVFKVVPFLQEGWGVLLAGYRGYGGNPGQPTEAGFYADGRAALDFLAQQRVVPGWLVLYGESLGSGIAVQMATEIGTGALVLEAPFTSLGDMAQRQFPYFPARWLVLDRFDSLAKIGDIPTPTLILHGARDAVVPVDLGRRLFDAANEPKALREFPAAGHVDLYDHGAERAVIEFVEKTVM